MSDLGADRQESGQPRAWSGALVGPLAVGGLTALAVFAAAARTDMPSGWVVAVLPGISSEIEVEGGARVELRVPGGAGADGLDGEQRALLDARLAATGGRVVEARGVRMVVELAGVPPHAADAWMSGLSRPGRLEMVEVDEGSEVMQQIASRAGSDPLAQSLGVFMREDMWGHDVPGGGERRYSDWYLEARTPSAITDYLEAAARANPSLAAPPGSRFAFERVVSDWTVNPDSALWRSYVVMDRSVIDNGDIESASAFFDAASNRAGVLLEMDADAGERFADWTGRLAGNKIAFLVDGRVMVAPVVTERISGHRAWLTMYDEPGRAWMDARTLAAVLTRPGLEKDSVLVKGAAPVAPTLTGTERTAARAIVALLCGLLVAAPLWLLGRRARPIAPGISRRPDRPRRGSVWGRAAVTAAGLGLAFGTSFLPWLPTIDVDASPELAQLAATSLGTFALGLSPFVSAFILVEIAALLVPRWRQLRVGGPAQRARLGSATAVLGVLLALAQAWFLTHWLAGQGFVPGAAGFWLTVLHFTAGAIVLALVALLIDRYGLASGFATLLLSGGVLAAVRLAASPVIGAVDLAAWLPAALGAALAIVATAGVARWQALPSSAARPFRLPTAGIVPLGWAAAVASLLALRPDLAEAATGWLAAGRVGGGRLAVELAFVVALAAGFSWLFSRPSRLGDATLVDAPATRRLWAGFAWATALSTGFVAALLVIERVVDARAGALALPVVTAATGTALVMDMVAEWKARWRRGDLVPIWPLHQVQRVDLVLQALAVNGIDAHARGVYLRSLLHFFGPYVPVVLFVPAAQADEARQVVGAQVGVTPVLSDQDRSPPPAG